MPLRRAFAVLGLCLLCAPLAAQTCDQQLLPPVTPRRDQAYHARVRKAIDEIDQLPALSQAVPPLKIASYADGYEVAKADWDQQIEDFKATHYYKKTEDFGWDRANNRPKRTTGKLPMFNDEVTCDENFLLVSPDGHRVTLSDAEFHYFLHDWISEENLEAIESFFSARDKAVAAAKAAKTSRFQGWFHRAVKDLDRQASGPSGASR